MKKTLLTASLVLLLLASCATKKPAETDVVPEVVQTTVVEEIQPEETQPSSETTQIVVDQPEEPVEETKTEDEQVLVYDENTVVSEPTVTSESATQIEEEKAPEQTIDENDWGYVFTSSEPQGASQQPSVEAAPAAVSESPKPAASKPEVAKPASEEDRTPSLFDKILQFISHEILFSVGLLVCLAGVIYLAIALVRSSSAYQRKRSERKGNDKKEQQGEPEESATDTDLSDEDDEFLRALLREDKR